MISLSFRDNRTIRAHGQITAPRSSLAPFAEHIFAAYAVVFSKRFRWLQKGHQTASRSEQTTE
jgi:hypothetical protein